MIIQTSWIFFSHAQPTTNAAALLNATLMPSAPMIWVPSTVDAIQDTLEMAKVVVNVRCKILYRLNTNPWYTNTTY